MKKDKNVQLRFTQTPAKDQPYAPEEKLVLIFCIAGGIALLGIELYSYFKSLFS